MPYTQTVFVIRADYGKYTEAFRLGGYAGIVWFEDDPATLNLRNKEAVKKHFKNVYSGHVFMMMNYHVGFAEVDGLKELII